MIPSALDDSSITTAINFLRQRWLRVALVSAFLLIPCFWHRQIEAGDLGSHVYNAWLAQLIQRGQAPGLYLSRQWNNVLFDLMLLKLANLFGFGPAEKIAVSVCVLVFFWGAFALVSAVAQRTAWDIASLLAMLAYGWTFNVGFFNYYLSLGLGFFATALVWRGFSASSTKMEQVDDRGSVSQGPAQRRAMVRLRGGEVALGLVLSALTFMAHPQGLAWLVACIGYVVLWNLLPGRWRAALFLAAAALIVVIRVYCSHYFKGWTSSVVWYSFGPGIYNGVDQIVLYRTAYLVLAAVAIVFGTACFVMDVNRERLPRESWRLARLPLELYCILVFATYVLPDVMRVPFYTGWIGSLALRLTTISAAFGLSVLALVPPRKWHTLGFLLIAACYFSFLYGDTGALNRMEQNIERLVSTLPPGQRVLATIWPPSGSRVPYIVHMVDRACVAKCFSYENYEPSSGEFRVRVGEDSPVVSPDADDTEAMQSGEYTVKPEDLPMWQIYQCDPQDSTKLCIRPLAAGEANNRFGYQPSRE